MKFRTFIISLVAIVSLLLLTAGAGAAWIAVNSPIARLQSAIATELTRPATAIFISRQSPWVALLRLNPDRLVAAKLLTAPAQRQDIQQGFEQLQSALLPDAQLNYSRDIQPWLGNEIALALTTSDFDRDRSNGAQLGYLVAMTAANPALAQRTLQAFWQRHSRAKALISESYAGVEITYRSLARRTKKQGGAQETNVLDGPTLATAVVGDRFVLLANSPKVLRDAINNVQATELNLENSEIYQQALDQVPPQAIGLAWGRLPQVLTRVGDQPVSQSASLLATWSLEAQESETLVANLRLLPAQGQSFPLNQSTQAAPVGALRFIPADSAFVASGTHLQDQLETAWAQRSLTALVQRSQQISLPEDAASWITGDYALAMLPHGNSAPDWIFVTQRSPAALAGLEQLDAIAQSHNVTLGSFMLETPAGSQEIFAWTKFSTQSLKSTKATAPGNSLSLAAEVQGVRTTVGEYEIFATSLEAVNLAIQSPEHSLLNQADFQAAIAALKKNNQGYLYLGQPAIRNWLRQFSDQADAAIPENSAIDHLLDRLQSLTFSSYGQTETVATGAISLRMMDSN